MFIHILQTASMATYGLREVLQTASIVTNGLRVLKQHLHTHGVYEYSSNNFYSYIVFARTLRTLSKATYDLREVLQTASKVTTGLRALKHNLHVYGVCDIFSKHDLQSFGV